MVERLNGIQEVAGSTPTISTIRNRGRTRGSFFIRAKRPQKTVRQIKNGGTQNEICVPPFLFRYIKSIKSPSRKTTLPETHPSDTPRPSMQWKANCLTTVFTIRLQLCIYCLIDSFKLVSVNRRITAEKQSPQ